MNRIIGITFLISLSGHCLLLGMPEFNVSSLQPEKPEDITVRIEIERPPLLPKIDVMGEEKKLKELAEEQESPEPEPETEVLLEEVTIEKPKPEPPEEMEPTQKAMLRYQDMVKQRIEEVRRYPQWAKERGIEGAVYLSFLVLANGQAQGIEITKSSGYRILDQAATATVQRANPFPPLPREITTPYVSMEVAIIFSLQ